MKRKEVLVAITSAGILDSRWSYFFNLSDGCMIARHMGNAITDLAQNRNVPSAFDRIS